MNDAISLSGPRSRPSGLRFGCSGTSTGLGPAPVPLPDTRLPRPEIRRCSSTILSNGNRRPEFMLRSLDRDDRHGHPRSAAARPYLARQIREVDAVSDRRLGIQRDNGGLGEPRPTIPPPETVLSPLAPISPCQHVPSRLRRAHLCTASSALWPTGQLINRSTRVFPVPPCHLASVPPLGAVRQANPP